MLRNLMLMLVTSTLAASLTLLLFTLSRQHEAMPPPLPPPLTIECVQALGTLTSTRVVVRVEQSEHYNGYLGALTLTWQGTGSVLLGPDLRAARITDRNDVDRTATVCLPPPAVLERTLDHTADHISAEFEGLWQITPDGALLAAGQRRLLQRAQASLVEGITAEHDAAARRSAEAVLHQLGQSVGWTIRVEWQEPPGRRSLRGERRPGKSFV